MKIPVLSLIASVFLFGTAAAAESQAGRVEWLLGPGTAFPQGGVADVAKPSIGIQAAELYGFNGWLSGGLEAGYWWAANFDGKLNGKLASDLDGDGINDTNITFTSDVDFRILQVTPCLKAGPWLKSGGWEWQPFVMAGAGLYQTSSNAGTVTVNGTTSSGFTFVNRTIGFPSQMQAWFGYNAGVGVSLKAGENLRLLVDVRYHQFFDGKPNAEILVPALRLGWLF